MKQLDKTAYEFVVESFKKEPTTNYTAIAKKLNSYNYVTKTNRPLCEKSLSKFMISKGYRRTSVRTKVTTKQTKDTTDTNKQLASLIYNSTKLTDDTKVKLLMGLI